MSRLAVAIFVLDVAGFVLAFNLSYRYAIALWLGWFSLPLMGVLLVQLMTLYVMDLYSVNDRASRFDVLTRTAFAVVVAGLITAGVVYITESRDTEPLFFRGVLPGGFVLFLAWAALVRYFAALWAQRTARRIHWLVLSDVEPDSPLCKDIATLHRVGTLTVLVDDPAKAERFPDRVRASVAGSFESFDQLVGDRRWSGIVIAAERSLPTDLLRRIMEMRLSGVRIYDLTDFYEKFMQKVPVLHLRDNWFVLSHGFDLLHHDAELKIKRLLDLGLAGVLLVLAMPMMVAAAVAIKLDRRGDAKGPILYRQLRTGANGVDFYIYKFRTMINNAERQGAQWAVPDDKRVTRVGRVLRRTRIDELPQLWNVLKGEMSFIGPRPERPDFNRRLEEEIPYYDLRHLVKPGITGWAQVVYDYGASIEDAREKLQYDIYYIKNYSLLLDLLIVLKTVRVMLSRRGR
ncbi:MAG: sugar transferase [Gammaproteobacteria bacterium]|nr:sugar transferase [Gammaproteobacteria bacterium]